jgi:predicted ribosomally synthesized peptide with SipW-like signal peptide
MRSRFSLRRVRAVLAVGPLVALSWAGAYAAFTDSVDATSTFSTGSVAIEANDQGGTVAFTSLSTSGMTPGTVTYAPLKIANTGSLDFDYAMATATGGSAALAAGLTIGVKVVGSSTCDASAYGGSSTVAYADAAGLGAAAIAARPLASGASEYLCFRVELPASADDSLQGLSTDATFTFTADPS